MMWTNDSINFILSKVLNCFYFIHVTLTHFHLYELTFLFLISVNVYFYYLYINDPSLYYCSILADIFDNTVYEIVIKSSHNSKYGYSIKCASICLSAVYCALFYMYYDTLEHIYLDALGAICSVIIFYIVWGFINIYYANLRSALKREGDSTPFIILQYLLSENKVYNFFWSKIRRILITLNNFFINNLNTHYAFMWSLLFCAMYTGWFRTKVDYLIETYLILFILFMFGNLIYAILFSKSSNRKVSSFFINQLLYIMLGAFFLTYISVKWYKVFQVKSMCLGGYYLLLNGVFYFKVWIVFFLLLSLILANTYTRQSMNSLMELSILFSAAVPVLFIITGLIDIFAIILSFEILSLLIIGLCGLTMDTISTEASVKYFCQNSIITGLTFLGIFFFLFIFKNTNILITQIFIELLYETKLLTYFFKVLLFSSIILWLLSFMFKFGIFPVNFYVADIYNGSSAPVILFISAVIKPTVLFVFSTKIIILFTSQIIVVSLISCFCIASIILGDWMSFNTNNLKRFFGHSSVSQYGFLLLSIFSESDRKSVV